MIVVDFRSERRLPKARSVLAMTLVVASALAVELARFDGARQRATALQRQRVEIVARVLAAQRARAAIADARSALDSALAIRRSNVVAARDIALFTNALFPNLALVELRREPGRWEVDARARDVADVVSSLHSLRRDRHLSAVAFDMRRLPRSSDFGVRIALARPASTGR
jgi:hypothetical protein